MTEVAAVRERTVEEQCALLLAEMARLRDFPVPPSDTDPPTVHAALRDDLRGRLDRAEVIMSDMARYRRRAKRTAQKLADDAADVYDAELARLAARAVTREYESIKDREVTARVKSSPQRREARAAERVADIVEEAEEAVRGMYFGLQGIRRELLATLEHYLPWESALERT